MRLDVIWYVGNKIFRADCLHLQDSSVTLHTELGVRVLVFTAPCGKQRGYATLGTI